MAKLQVANKTVIHPEVPSLIRDIILSLCQRKYSGIPSIEVDGIICISFQDSSEQQVVKIHENLPSQQASVATEQDATHNDIRKLDTASESKDLGLHLEVENIDEKVAEGHSDEGSQPDEIDNGESKNFSQDISFLSSLLKSTNDMITTENGVVEKKKKKVKGIKHDAKEKVNRRKRKNPVHHPKASPKKAYTDESLTERTDSVETNKEVMVDPMVVVKQEVLDEETNPKIVDVFSANSVHTHQDPAVLNDRSGLARVTSEYNGEADNQSQELQYQTLGLRRSESAERQTCREASEPNDDANLNINIVIKQEREDDGEFDAAYGNNDNIAAMDSEVLASMYDIAEDPDYNPLADEFGQGYSSSSDRGSSKSKSAGVVRKRKSKKEDNNANRGWFEMVRNNVTRYQAALLKSMQITRKGAEASGPTVQKEYLDGRNCNDLEESHMLKTMLQKPISKENSDRDQSASPTLSASVKKESLERTTKNSESKSTEPKLLSKYPALFNQLQKPKEAENNCEAAPQQDSLVNRLPFLSFKDLFAQASPVGTSSGIDMRPSPERLADLLSQPSALVRPPCTRSGQAGQFRKRRWIWKKRAVRPKGPNGEILSHKLPQLADSDKSNIPVGIANPKRQKSKSKDKDDRDWHPHHANAQVLSNVSSSVSTRRSSGRVPQTNFTEFSDSDIEEIEDVVEEEPEIISAYCKYNCGTRFDSINELRAHEETCLGSFKCEYCGLDFNQQYRWQYHMIKVHGVSVDSGMFR